MKLTVREREILRLVCDGLTDGEVGSRLFVSMRTVQNDLRRIRDKTGLERRSARIGGSPGGFDDVLHRLHTRACCVRARADVQRTIAQLRRTIVQRRAPQDVRQLEDEPAR